MISNYSTFIYPIESEICGKKRKKILQMFEYLENKKSFLDEIMIAFHSFVGVSFDDKINNSRQKL